MHPRTKIHDIGVGRLAVRRKPGRRMARPLDTRGVGGGGSLRVMTLGIEPSGAWAPGHATRRKELRRRLPNRAIIGSGTAGRSTLFETGPRSEGMSIREHALVRFNEVPGARRPLPPLAANPSEIEPRPLSLRAFVCCGRSRTFS